MPANASALELASTVWPNASRTRNGTPRVQTVEHRPIGDRSVRPHALLEPADHFQPAVGFAALVLVEADLKPGAELGDGQRLVVQRAVNLTQAAFERVHVPVDEPGHGESTLEIDHARARSDQRGGTGIVAGIDEPALTDGDGVHNAVVPIGGVDAAMTIDEVGWPRLDGQLRRRLASEHEAGEEESWESAHGMSAVNERVR
jgi:hypothetical protein